MSIAENISEVKEEVRRALEESGRPGDNVTIVAVTKYSDAEAVLEAARAGQTELAENRVQMLIEKWNALDEMRKNGIDVPEISWHLIGHLQTNKVKYVVGKVKLIHSCDSLKLAREISQRSEKIGVVTHILIEVNVSGEESKSGVKPEEAEELARACAELPGIRVDGLMTMAPRDADEALLTDIFSKTHKIFVDINKKNIYNLSMTTLSMGMSADFVTAVRCGSNMIRVGHRIFG